MVKTTKTFNVSFPKDLIDEIDAVAERQFGSRSDLLRTAAIDYINRQKERERGNNVTYHYASEEEVTEIANDLLKKYRQDFHNLAKR